MIDILNKWTNGLTKTRNQTFGKIVSLFGNSEITNETWDELETLLIQADLGASVTLDVIQKLRQKVSSLGIIKKNAYMELLIEDLKSRLITKEIILPSQRPIIVLIVGVNGSGKTTSIAKLGSFFQNKGYSIMFGAADTFRAAAVDQLKIWGSRLSIPVVFGQDDADPGAVAFDAITAARSKNIDILLIDTAGRLHTRYNLMEELKKVYRVCGKAMQGSPHFVWLVLDSTTGQNALNQAKVFQKDTNVDGIILAKLDSSAKGGMVFAIQEELNLPILFAGLGEQPEDFVPFDAEKFVRGILDSGG